jgi:hypothetical protein
MVTLDGTGVTLTFGYTRYIDELTHLKYFDTDCGTRLQASQLLRGYSEFFQCTPRFHTRLGVVSGSSLTDATGTAHPVCQLHSGVAIGVHGFNLSDTIVGHFQHCHRQRRTVIGKNAGHANLATDKS